ncbi:MAG: PEP-CTERM sorting domain-containing protein [Phycisphaerae bacterium]|nr:PEP-CTERM sorting domain-containing protein [Phycisphaerae bacterium]
MFTRKGMKQGLLMLLAVSLGSSSALALVHHTDENGDVIVMPSALHPSDDICPALNNSWSCVAINPNYILTAGHYSVTTGMPVNVGGTTYYVADSVDMQNSYGLDLEVIRIQTAGGQPANLTNWAKLYDYADEVGQTSVIGGRGRTNASGDSRIYCDPPNQNLVCGYNDGSSTGLIWGTNKVRSALDSIPGYAKTFGYVIEGKNLMYNFDEPNSLDATSYEVNAKNYDSGAGCFAQDNNTWKIMGLVTGATSPTGPTYFRNKTTGESFPYWGEYTASVRISKNVDKIIEAASSIGTWDPGTVTADTSWTGSQSGAWTNAQNWTSGVPASTDIVKIDSSAQQVVINTTGCVANELHVGVTTNASINQQSGQLDIGGTLEIGSRSGGSGAYLMNGGQLNAKAIYVGFNGGNGQMCQYGDVTTDTVRIGGVNSTGAYQVKSSGTLTANRIHAKGLLIVEGAIDVKELYFKEQNGFIAYSGASITLRGGTVVLEENINPMFHGGWSNLEMISSGLLTTIEVAGEDMGADEDGLVTNFAIETLVLGDEDFVGQIRLVDNYDNQVGSDEAMYVEELIVNEGSYLDLAGQTLYYDSADIDGYAALVDTVGGGMLMEIGAQEADELNVLGDANLDGIVNLSDLTILGQNWGIDDGTATWAQGDFDGDGIVYHHDQMLLMDHWLETGRAAGGGVPEPATISLTAVGLLGVLRRRRK